jgi:sortase A
VTDESHGGALSVPPPSPQQGRHRRSQGLFAVARLIAVGCLLAGAGFVAYTGYRIWDPGARGAQRQMLAKLHTQWGEHAGTARPVARVRLRLGQPFAIMRIPRFGPDWQFAIVEGTGLQQLADGPGHVQGTGLPGTSGNFAVAAHDITAGNPFMHLASLRRGDAVIVQIGGTTYRYAVRSEGVVRYTDTAVLYPVPDHRYVRPTTQYITLITCTPVTLDWTPWRIVVTGTLVAATSG